MGELEEFEVKDIAEDDVKLKEFFEKKTCYQGSKVEGWLTPHPHPQVRGPSDHTTAIVIKKNSGTGRVDIVFNDKYVGSYDTRPDAGESVVMVFLKPQHYCWWMGDAAAKYVSKV